MVRLNSLSDFHNCGHQLLVCRAQCGSNNLLRIGSELGKSEVLLRNDCEQQTFKSMNTTG